MTLLPPFKQVPPAGQFKHAGSIELDKPPFPASGMTEYDPAGHNLHCAGPVNSTGDSKRSTYPGGHISNPLVKSTRKIGDCITVDGNSESCP